MAAQWCERCNRLRRVNADLRIELRGLLQSLRLADTEIQQLRRQNKDLEERLVDALRASKRQAAPFARARTQRRRKRPGRRRGHPPAHRSWPDQIDEEVNVPLASCPHCNGPVAHLIDHQQVQLDIPPVRPFSRRFHTQSGYCRRCRRRVHSRHPEQTSDAAGAAGIQLGARVVALAADLKHRLGVTYRKVAELLWIAFRFRVSAGGLWRAIARLADKCIPSYLALVEKLRLSSVVSADETGWRIARQGVWLWVFATDELTVYVIAASRNIDVPQEVLGEHFGGILLTDGWQAYRSLPYQKAQCARHLLRRCDEELEIDLSWEPQLRRGKAFPRAIKRLLQRAIQLKHQRALMSPAAYEKKVARLEKRFGKLIRRRFRWHGHMRLAKSLKWRQSQVLLFLKVPELPPTNNLAEQQIRPAVVLRKISAGNRTSAGAFVHQILASVTQSAYRSGQRFVDFASSLLKSPQPLIAPLTMLTDINLGGTLEPVRRNSSEPCRESREDNFAPPPSEPRRIHRNSERPRGAHRRTRCLTRRSQAPGPSPP
jgi:transposase